MVHDHSRHGWLSLQQIIKFSSNIGAVKISEKIGAKILYQTLQKFGFGSKTGIDCPGETTGSLSYYASWSEIDIGAISFGHGIAVSAVQLIRAVSAIANDGILMKPYVVMQVLDQNGQVVKHFKPQPVRRVVSDEKVIDNQGKVALQRGPLVYCLEGIDNEAHVLKRHFPEDVSFEVKSRPDLLGGIMTITGKDAEGRMLVVIPYYAWSHRGIGEMAVWLPRKHKK